MNQYINQKVNIDLVSSQNNSEEEQNDCEFEIPQKMNLCKWIEIKKSSETKPKKVGFEFSEKDRNEISNNFNKWITRRNVKYQKIMDAYKKLGIKPSFLQEN